MNNDFTPPKPRVLRDVKRRGESSFAPLPPTRGGEGAGQQEEERKVLETQLAELESQITQYEKTIASYKKQGSTLKSEIDRLNAQVAKLNLQIRAITLSLSRLNQQISATQSKIGVTESDIDQNKEAIGKLLQDLYEREDTGLIEVMLANPRLSDFFGNLNNLLAVQDSLRVALGKVDRKSTRLNSSHS